MNRVILPFSLVMMAISGLTATAGETTPAKEKAAKNPDATKFIRVDRDKKNVRLQTAISSYTKNGVSVDLIGAIHIADAKYYTRLNKEFTNYEALLFEMVGGENMNKAKANDPNRPDKGNDGKKDAKDPILAILGDVYGMIANLLELQGQGEGIDYKAKNFVHADLTQQAFTKLQKEKGESIIGFALQNARNADQQQFKQPDMQRLLIAFLGGNANGIKLELVDTLGAADDMMAGMAGQSVIIGDRNDACLKVLDTQIKTGKKKLGIFYGAAHFPDMEKDMLEAGYKKTGHRWLTAWDIPKAAQEKKKAPAKLPDAA